MAEQENKYFTPNITDLRVGYNCEVKWDSRAFEKKVFNIEDIFIVNRVGLGNVRTPYITKEQIEDEGWDEIWNNGRSFKKSTGGYYCNLHMGKYNNEEGERDQSTFVDITCIRESEIRDGRTERLFSGDCPSINEFRYICKLLNIK